MKNIPFFLVGILFGIASTVQWLKFSESYVIAHKSADILLPTLPEVQPAAPDPADIILAWPEPNPEDVIWLSNIAWTVPNNGEAWNRTGKYLKSAEIGFKNDGTVVWRPEKEEK